MTRDRDARAASIESFEGRKARLRAAQRLRARLHRRHAGAHRRGSRNQVALSAINALAVHLGSLTDRRKTLIVVTDSRRPHGSAARPGVSADARHDHPIGEPVQRGGLSVRPARHRRRPVGRRRSAPARGRNRRPGDRRRRRCRPAPRRQPTRAPTTCCRSAPRIPTTDSSASCRRASSEPAPVVRARERDTDRRRRTKRCARR